MMRLKTAIKFELDTNKQPLIIFYGIMLLIYTAAVISNIFTDVTAVSGTELSSMIFIFIMSIVSFKEFLQFSLQHGNARRDILIAFICSMGVLSLAMSLIDTALTLILASYMDYHSMYDMAYKNSNILLIILWQAFIYWGITAIGSFINLLYYRLNKLGKILVSVSVPVIILPGLASIGNNITIHGQPLFKIIRHNLSTPLSIMMVSLFTVALFSFFNSLLIRKATIN